MDNLETRVFEMRVADVEERTVTGIAVPYGQTANIGGQYEERFARGAIQTVENTKLYFQHREIIGRVIEGRETDAGYEITAKISDTSLGRDAYALIKDQAIGSFSVGFIPIEQTREGNVVTRTLVDLREVSLVDQPAYTNAEITQVREADEPDAEPTETPEIPEQLTESESTLDNLELDVRAIADEVAELRRTVDANAQAEPQATPVIHRSAGEALKAIAHGDDIALRAYTGGTTADAIVMDGWVGDLTRLVDEAAILRGVFGSATLPSEGNFIEYGVLDANTMVVDVQAAEGDDLEFGKVSVTTQTAPVKTLGGWTQLTRQEIERSSTNILDLSLRAQAMQVGKALNTLTRNAYIAAHAAQVTATNTVAVANPTSYADWIGAITDASVKFQALGLGISALVVDADTFKVLATLEAADGRPVLLTSGNGVNNVGTINVVGLAGELASVTVVMDPALEGEIAFVNRAALTVYGSPVVRLQDENIINLSKDFSVYTYAATAVEVPAAIIPVIID
jgi:HK97 family phage prohead protease